VGESAVFRLNLRCRELRLLGRVTDRCDSVASVKAATPFHCRKWYRSARKGISASGLESRPTRLLHARQRRGRCGGGLR